MIRPFRDPRTDVALVAAVALHAAVLVTLPHVVTVGGLLWWTANTSAHYFIHRPFFRSRVANAWFSALLTAVLGFPQELWRQRHLAHHAGRASRIVWRGRMVRESILTLLVWGLWIGSPWFAVAWLPGFLFGQLLCGLHGLYEHRGGGTTSHYGRLYNALFFNDGHHREHHERPGCSWRDLPRVAVTPGGRSSRWPAALRWLEDVKPSLLGGLERLALRSTRIQRWLVDVHAQAVAQAVGTRVPRRVVVVGGGLFPRSALVARRLWPAASIVVLDNNEEHLRIAASRCGPGVQLRLQHVDAGEDLDADLAFVPLAFRGSPGRLYRDVMAPTVVVHDWIWKPRGESRVVTPLLLKRVNVIRRASDCLVERAS